MAEEPALPENWVDVAILFVLATYALQGLQRGFIMTAVDLVAFVVSLLVALRLYPLGAELLQPYLPLPPTLLKPIAFFGAWLIADVVLGLVTRALAAPLALIARLSSVNGLLGLVPGALKGAVVAALVLALVMALPLPEPVKADVTASALGSRLANEVPALERVLQDVLGDAVLDSISFATIRPQADERVNLKFTVVDPRIDATAETRMLQLVNDERARAGLPPLKHDDGLAATAREHARDMLARGYFAHADPEGRTPSDRLRTAGVPFAVTGENLALAPTLELAHRGLMDSPGHRANLLSPEFTRAGIGVLDANLHGKMFAQDFAN